MVQSHSVQFYQILPFFIGCFAWLLLLAFGAFVIVYLVKIHNALDKIQNRLDRLESSGQEPTPQI
jgi:hypothetical protein